MDSMTTLNCGATRCPVSGVYYNNSLLAVGDPTVRNVGLSGKNRLKEMGNFNPEKKDLTTGIYTEFSDRL